MKIRKVLLLSPSKGFPMVEGDMEATDHGIAWPDGRVVPWAQVREFWWDTAGGGEAYVRRPTPEEAVGIRDLLVAQPPALQSEGADPVPAEAGARGVRSKADKSRKR